MTNFKILICEDDTSDNLNIELHIKSVNRELMDFEISYKSVDFSTVFQELNNDYDLIILDLFDEVTNSDKGSQVLMHNFEKNKTPTIIYTSAGDELEFDINSKKNQYPFIQGKFTKISNSGEELKKFLKGYIICSKDHKFFNLYNLNDKKLIFSIKQIGESHFNYILYSFKKENEINNDIIVYPMALGWSGAVLFKLKINDDIYVLKLSNDVKSLKSEFDNSKKLYSNFPSQLINPIFPQEYYSFDNTVFGFSIKSIDNSIPLLTYILSEVNDVENIKRIFNEIFLSSNSLKNHYNIRKNGFGDWSNIFNNIYEGKIEWIKQAYNDLKTIILKFHHDINIDDFRRITISNDFKQFSKSNLIENKYNKELVLSHGDFHANNILIQDQRPFIIDTGALAFQHWSIDITRLLTSIFILGFDKDKIEYFDLNRIEYYKKIGESIIDLTPIEIEEEEQNDNVIIAINWIIENIRSIYETQFSLFEFQLCLMKEFLQVSYRIETVPPNKRALALILADISLTKANENLA